MYVNVFNLDTHISFVVKNIYNNNIIYNRQGKSSNQVEKLNEYEMKWNELK